MNLSLPKNKALLPAVLAVLLLWSGYCLWLWQPERQVALHQRHLLDAIERRQWNALRDFLADDFEDAQGHDKVWVLKESREMLRHFHIFLTIEDRDTTHLLPERTDGSGPVVAKVHSLLRIDGRGSALVDEIKRRVNATDEPFEFHWRKSGWKPWEWQLVYVTHPLLGQAYP
ncbi:MAG TPA: hypothetical protein VNQ90_04710 [Chthoniobacteraceae bacterium]|nr:hypothetical protein [Chthoniobacteraceae bacterium]